MDLPPDSVPSRTKILVTNFSKQNAGSVFETDLFRRPVRPPLTSRCPLPLHPSVFLLPLRQPMASPTTHAIGITPPSPSQRRGWGPPPPTLPPPPFLPSLLPPPQVVLNTVGYETQRAQCFTLLSNVRDFLASSHRQIVFPSPITLPQILERRNTPPTLGASPNSNILLQVSRILVTSK